MEWLNDPGNHTDDFCAIYICGDRQSDNDGACIINVCGPKMCFFDM